MAQKIKMLTAKLGDLRAISRTPWKRETNCKEIALWLLHVLRYMCKWVGGHGWRKTHAHTLTLRSTHPVQIHYGFSPRERKTQASTKQNSSKKMTGSSNKKPIFLICSLSLCDFYGTGPCWEPCCPLSSFVSLAKCSNRGRISQIIQGVHGHAVAMASVLLPHSFPTASS